MAITEKSIIAAYMDAAKEEVALMKAEEALRKQLLEVESIRHNLVRYKDAITQMHRDISEPIVPFADCEESVMLKTI